MRKTVTLACQNCRTIYTRPTGDEGRGKYCSQKCARAAQPRPTREERFWRQVAKGEGCWEWTGVRSTAGGHGTIRTGPRGSVRQEYAHRVSWEIHFGPIPDGLFVCHHCDNPPCVRPDHLFLGTLAMNNRDRDRKGRHRPVRGEQVGTSKMTEAVVRELRAKRAAGALLRELAAEYGLSVYAVHAATTGRTWKHVA